MEIDSSKTGVVVLFFSQLQSANERAVTIMHTAATISRAGIDDSLSAAPSDGSRHVQFLDLIYSAIRMMIFVSLARHSYGSA